MLVPVFFSLCCNESLLANRVHVAHTHITTGHQVDTFSTVAVSELFFLMESERKAPWDIPLL